jgi:hypothetical protein
MMMMPMVMVMKRILYQVINLVLYYRVIGVKVPLVYSILNSNT